MEAKDTDRAVTDRFRGHPAPRQIAGLPLVLDCANEVRVSSTASSKSLTVLVDIARQAKIRHFAVIARSDENVAAGQKS